MAKEDFSVVLGVTYPAGGPFTELQGTLNDGDAFLNWVTDPDGGNVPVANVTTVGLPGSTFGTDQQSMEDAFADLVRRANSGNEWHGRLFIFASGHGFSTEKNSIETGFVASNSTVDKWRYLPVHGYADFFSLSGMFDSVFLFLDCCRTKQTDYPISETGLRHGSQQFRNDPTK